jgi:hypothetical protein
MAIVAALLLAFGGQQTTFEAGYEVRWTSPHVIVSVYVSEPPSVATPDSLNVLVVG